MIDLFIKNMVCDRCIAAVTKVLEQENLHPISVKLGKASIETPPTAEQLAQLRVALFNAGFELLDDAKAKIIDQIKTLIIAQVHYDNSEQTLNFSDLITSKLHKDYSYLSHLFSDTEGITIEKYIILQKMERVKELLAYQQKSLSEIAYEMGYSSVAHLSGQFKKTTGQTPSQYKNDKAASRNTLDQV